MYIKLDSTKIPVVKSYRDFYKNRLPRTEEVSNEEWVRLTREAVVVDRKIRNARLYKHFQDASIARMSRAEHNS